MKKIIFIFLLSTLCAQSETKITISIFDNDKGSLILNSQQNGLYQNLSSSSNIKINHSLKLPDSKIQLSQAWYVNDEGLNLLKLSLSKKGFYGTTLIGMFPVEKVYQSNYSTGSMVFSENAQNIPAIGFNSNWIKFFNLMEVKFETFNGQFPSQKNYSLGPYLHYKSVLFKKDYDLAKFGFQIQHAVQFGGNDQFGNKIPINLRTYLRMVASQSGDSTQPGQDQNYKIGNGVGSYIFSFDREYKNLNFILYYEHFFDDKSGAKLKNLGDGLKGLQISSSNFIFNFERLDTRNQSGNQHPPGVDSYYWHRTYEFGWSNDGNSIGNAFISPTNNRKFLNSLSIERQFKKFNLIAKYIDVNEYEPYLDKNKNLPYTNHQEIISKKYYSLIGIKLKINEDSYINFISARENGFQINKLSYTIDI